jgi:hypothetical protein
VTDKAPRFPTSTIGRIPAIIVKFPREFRVSDLAALVARAGFRIRWIRRGKAAG